MTEVTATARTPTMNTTLSPTTTPAMDTAATRRRTRVLGEYETAIVFTATISTHSVSVNGWLTMVRLGLATSETVT